MELMVKAEAVHKSFGRLEVLKGITLAFDGSISGSVVGSAINAARSSNSRCAAR